MNPTVPIVVLSYSLNLLFIVTVVGLWEACLKTEWQVHAFCLMPNHFHLVVETPRANLVAGMKMVLGAATSSRT
jgi:REP element-mobilizing transposase RayT